MGKSDEAYANELLGSWEATYKKGQLTFWLLLALRDRSLYLSEIKDFITKTTKGTISCEEQSLYRSLRKYADLEIVDYDLRAGNKGPDRKYYYLTPLGKQLLERFIQRNILLFYDPELHQTILNQPAP